MWKHPACIIIGSSIIQRRYSQLIQKVDGDIQQCISHENAIDRLRMYETMSPKRRIIDTRLIKWNSKFGPSNNCSILLYKGFNKKGTLEKLT